MFAVCVSVCREILAFATLFTMLLYQSSQLGESIELHDDKLLTLDTNTKVNSIEVW